MKHALGFLVLLLAGCENGEASVVARIGWQFDYKDWTDTSAEADVRGCDNQPAANGGPAYDAIAKVHVLFEDPEGQVPGVDTDYDCDKGDGQQMDIVGLTRQEFHLRLEAKNAAGQVLYAHDVEKVDLSSLVEETYTLETTTGELHFFPNFPDTTPGDCPDADTLAFEAFEVVDGTRAEAAALSGAAALCEDFSVAEIFIRNIPSHPVQGFSGGYSPTQYSIDLTTTGGTSYCATLDRAVKPGRFSLGGDPTLNPCP